MKNLRHIYFLDPPYNVHVQLERVRIYAVSDREVNKKQFPFFFRWQLGQ